MTTVIDIADPPARVGEHLGHTAWPTITSDAVVEARNTPKPSCAAQVVFRFYR
jgi:hypothetical protein